MRDNLPKMQDVSKIGIEGANDSHGCFLNVGELSEWSRNPNLPKVNHKSHILTTNWNFLVSNNKVETKTKLTPGLLDFMAFFPISLTFPR